MIVDELRTEVVDRSSDSRGLELGGSASDGRPSSGVARLLRGRADAPAWERPALVALLGATALLYLWGLGASGWANTYYSAAVQAGAKSWKAFFFGSLDAGNSITVDKSPGFLWVMELSARMFGVNSWSILVPQALEGVAAVGVLYATVRRWFSPAAALLAGLVLATTPVAALMFRFNNPDALLVLVLTGAAYALTRALELGSTRWVVFAFSLVGFGFLAKMLQAFIVLPAFGLVYLFAGPPRLGRRVWQLFLGGVAMLASAGWWIAIVQLTPAANRPYIGGSQNNSLWNLMFGYNGFGRLTGNENGSVTNGGASPWGITGLTRLFNADFGGQISWLLPAALVLLAAGLAFTWNRPRTDRTRTALLLWGGWLVVTSALFSFGKGIIHPYYSVALGPAIGAVVGIGAVTLWSRRSAYAQYVLTAAFAVTVVWSYVLLDRTPTWHPWLRAGLAISSFVVLAAMMLWHTLGRRSTVAVAAGAVVVALLGPGAYTLATAATPHNGAIPSAGPTVAGGFGRGGRVAFRRGGFRAGGFVPPGFGQGGFGQGGAGQGAVGPGGFGQGAAGPGGGGPVTSPTPRGIPGFGAPPGGAVGGGGFLNGTSVSAAARSLLESGSSGFRWVAATVDANNAASYQLATGRPIMAIGGFNGTDPSPTLSEFERAVAAHEIHYFIAGGGGGGPGRASGAVAGEITSWVEGHFTPTTVGGVTLYDLSVGQ
ncbi:MAG: ArnT family glycosyltransferase [Acidimicrobiia bacterium]